MDLKEWADRLNGRECGSVRIVSHAEGVQAKAEGVVIVYGASDDLMEFAGAIDEELYGYEGRTAYIIPTGILKDRDEFCAGCKYWIAEKKSSIQLNAIWEPKLMDGASWLIEAPEILPHEHFDIMEDGELFCRGLVFRLADVKAPESAEELASKKAAEELREARAIISRVRELADYWRKMGSSESNRFADDLEEALK